jgi:hypothetical protein
VTNPDKDVDKDVMVGRIKEVTNRFPNRCFAFDQFGPLPIRPCRGASGQLNFSPPACRATYRGTHGVRYFHGCDSLGDDQLLGGDAAPQGR